MEQSEWIGALLVEAFLSQKACNNNKIFLQKTFEYLNLSNDLLEKDISNVPELPLQCLYPIIHFTTPIEPRDIENIKTSPALSHHHHETVPYDDNEVKLEKFLAMKMGKEQETLVTTLKAADTQEAKVNEYHAFMAEAFPRAERICTLLKHDDVSLYKALENIFCPKIYDQVFPPSPVEDTEFAIQAAKLRSKESFLGVTPEIIQKIKNVYALAGSELEQMERHVSPYAKLGCIERCMETLMKALGRVGADDLLPAVIYTVVQCNPTRLPSNLQYTLTFGDERAFLTQQGYCHTTLVVAMEVVSRQKFEENNEKGGTSCPKCRGLGGLNCFGEPCKKGENLYQIVCPTCNGSCVVKGTPRICEQCLGMGGKAKLGYCEVTDPFAIGKCEVCKGKCYLFGDTAAAPAPASPLSAFSQYYGTELTPSKYGFYRQTSGGTVQAERVMLPDLLSALILFSLTSSFDQKGKPKRPASRPIPKVTLGRQPDTADTSGSLLPSLHLPTSSLKEFAIEMKPLKSPRKDKSSPEQQKRTVSPTRLNDTKPKPPPRNRNNSDASKLNLRDTETEITTTPPKRPPRNRNNSDATKSPQNNTSILDSAKSLPRNFETNPSTSNSPSSEPPTIPPRNNFQSPSSSKHPLNSSGDVWMVGVKKEITVFYPAPVRSALKRMIHCLRSLGSMSKREQDRDSMLEAAEQTIATKWIHEMEDGRSLLAGEGYGINLGSDGVKEIYFHRVEDLTTNVACNDALPPPHMHALIAVMGVIDSNAEESFMDDLNELMRDQVDVECDKYILVWETQHLRRFGDTIKLFHHTSVQEARSTSAFPIAPMMIANQFKNAGVLANHPYIYLLQQAKKGGKILAEKLMRMGLGRRPVTLVGVSFGALLVFSCLEVLLESSAQQSVVNSLIENVIFIGANVPADTNRWNAIKPIVSGRIVNCFSTKDAFLKYFYQTVNSITGGINISAAGVTAIPVTNIENVDISSFATSHVFYAKNQTISAILNFVDVGGVECNRNFRPVKRKSQQTSALSNSNSIPPPPPPPPPFLATVVTEPVHMIGKLVNTIQSYIPHQV